MCSAMTKLCSRIQLRKVSLGDLRCPHDTKIVGMQRLRLAGAIARFPMATVLVVRLLFETGATLRAFE